MLLLRGWILSSWWQWLVLIFAKLHPSFSCYFDNPALPTVGKLNLGTWGHLKWIFNKTPLLQMHPLYPCHLVTNYRLERLMIRLKNMTINAHLTARSVSWRSVAGKFIWSKFLLFFFPIHFLFSSIKCIYKMVGMNLACQLNPKDRTLQKSGLCFLHSSVLQALARRQEIGKTVVFSDIFLVCSAEPKQHCWYNLISSLNCIAQDTLIREHNCIHCFKLGTIGMKLPWQQNPKESTLEEPSGLCFLHGKICGNNWEEENLHLINWLTSNAFCMNEYFFF